MPIPHEEMRRIVKRRIQGLEGTERIRALRACLEELPGYYQGPYGQLRKWILGMIAQAEGRREVRHQDAYFVPRQGSAQVALVGAPNAGKSSLLAALTGRPVAVADYAFTTLRPAAGMVDVGGAQLQLMDLPGLVAGAADGRGGGRAALAQARAADAVLYVAPLSTQGEAEFSLVEAELARQGLRAPSGVVATKLDLEGAVDHLPALRALAAPRPVVACSVVRAEGLDAVRDLAWRLCGRMRVFCRPRGAPPAVRAVVLARGATVRDLAAHVSRAWAERLRGAHVSGPSARFPEQRVGPGHVLADGDVVELLLA